jgi:hypothetical protein
LRLRSGAAFLVFLFVVQHTVFIGGPAAHGVLLQNPNFGILIGLAALRHFWYSNRVDRVFPSWKVS